MTAIMTAEYVGTVARSGFQAMSAADPDAVWVDSAWRFLANKAWWMGPKNDGARMKAFLHAVPQGRHISRDLAAETAPIWQSSDSFYGTDWLWGMIQNFGGRECGTTNQTIRTAFEDAERPNHVVLSLTKCVCC